MGKHLTALVLLAALLFGTATQAQVVRVLWWDGSPPYDGATDPRDRATMALFVDSYAGGQRYAVTFEHSTRRGDLAQQLGQAAYDIIVLDVTTRRQNFTTADLEAVRAHYRNGKRALMLDGTLWVRNARPGPLTLFPGPNGAGAALLMNQIEALANAGGGILIGTDHIEFQVGANQLLAALVPGARFSGRTNPSRDGDFLGDVLLNTAIPVRPMDILRHWEEIPSQAEAPVGQFTDFMGNPVTLYPLVETSDKPGGRKKRPYISANFDPGGTRTAIDSAVAPVTTPEPEPVAEPEPEPVKDYMPTRKSKID